MFGFEILFYMGKFQRGRSGDRINSLKVIKKEDKNSTSSNISLYLVLRIKGGGGQDILVQGMGISRLVNLKNRNS